ncbi:MAG: nucleoside hydrolase [Tannerella sp.]|jgi:inosine-uridine nucleoside N-ribohydrolase|nr:nucleoside hydrolase [Tannerella sp.]
MGKYLIFLLVLLSFVACTQQKTETVVPVAIIFDTDLGPDYDDVGALTLLHALADSGKVEILATISSNKNEWVVPCIEVINTYFNRPLIPVGAPKSEGGVDLTTWHKVKWTEVLPAKYKHQTPKTSDAPDAVKVYRKVLSNSPDQGVVICTVGFLTNLKDLLLSVGDESSPLSGKALITRKVKHVVSMAGWFPEGREFNVHCDTPASIVVFENWPTDIILSGFEIGKDVLTGKKLVQMNVEGSPVKETYELCFAEGDPNGRNSWDQTATLVAAKGFEPYYNAERGIMRVDSIGKNDWTPSENGTHIRLIHKFPPEEIASMIETYMMHQPIQ